MKLGRRTRRRTINFSFNNQQNVLGSEKSYGLVLHDKSLNSDDIIANNPRSQHGVLSQLTTFTSQQNAADATPITYTLASHSQDRETIGGLCGHSFDKFDMDTDKEDLEENTEEHSLGMQEVVCYRLFLGEKSFGSDKVN